MRTSRHWTADEVAALKIMARKYPASQIAGALGRGIEATFAKAHKLKLSLRVNPAQTTRSNIDPGAAGMDLT